MSYLLLMVNKFRCIKPSASAVATHKDLHLSRDVYDNKYSYWYSL